MTFHADTLAKHLTNMFSSTTSNKLCLVLGGVVLLWLFYKARQYLRLSHIKGPFLTGWFSLLHSKAIYTDNVHLWYTQVNQKYGEYSLPTTTKLDSS